MASLARGDDGIVFRISSDNAGALRAVAKKALKKGTGARARRGIVEDARIGSVIEIGPADTTQRPSDRTITAIAENDCSDDIRESFLGGIVNTLKKLVLVDKAK